MKDSKPLTNDNDETIVELCNPETGDVMPIATRHDGGARLSKLRAAGWCDATQEDKDACLTRASK